MLKYYFLSNTDVLDRYASCGDPTRKVLQLVVASPSALELQIPMLLTAREWSQAQSHPLLEHLAKESQVQSLMLFFRFSSNL